MASQKLVMLRALTDHLKGITPSNGFTYDLSASVFRGRDLFGENDPVPLVSILESSAVPRSLYAGENNTTRKDQLPLLVQGWAQDDVMNPTDPAYELMDAVETRLSQIIQVNAHDGNPTYPLVYLLGRRIAGLEYGPGKVRPPTAQVSSKAFFYLPVLVTLASGAG